MSNIIALSIVGLALCYVAWRIYRLLAKKEASGCGTGCNSCPQASADDRAGRSRPFVSIDQLAAGQGKSPRRVAGAEARE